MLESPEARGKLAEKLESWPAERRSPVTINMGLEMLAIIEAQEKTIRHLQKSLLERASLIKALDNEANWLAHQAAENCQGENCPQKDAPASDFLYWENCRQCRRKAASEATGNA